jgi:DNA-3-methyladenine glycosylase I
MDDLRTGPDGLARAVGDDAEYRRYHDEEWGRPPR